MDSLIETKGIVKKIVSYALMLVLLINMTSSLQYKVAAQMSLNQMTDANIVAVESGSYHVIALDEDGLMWALGQGTYGRLGIGSTSNQSSPQKITTTYDGSPMPVIKQISVSQQNSLALDVNGNVWVWGWNNNGSIGVSGISGNITRPIQIPALSNITYISSAYLGGRAIDADGALWVWGRNYQSSIGDASSNDVTIPKKLTQGLDSSGTAIDISTEKFVAVAASDYFDQMCNIALTENGTIYTWGNNNNSSYGGSSRPKKIIATHSSSSIQTLPSDIKKIDVNNGGFSFLDGEGNIWTWGAAVIVTNNLGHGNASSYALPKKVDHVKMSTGGSAQAAPKFVDYSRYAWSMMAVDVSGNIYGCGENQYSHHMGIGSQNTLTKYAGPTLVDAVNNRIIKVSEGYYVSTYIDIHGNLYYTGTAGSGYGSNYDETYVRFPNINTKIRFTNIESTPARGQHLYSNETASLKVTVNTPVLTTGAKVKYVKIYKDNPNYELAFASNTGVVNSYGVIGNKIFMQNTNPQLLISESYALASSQFYANTKISKEVFDSAYAQAESTDKGELTAVISGLTYVLNGINDNCMIWLQTEGVNGGSTVTNRMIYVYEDFYRNVEIYHEGVRNDNGKILYSKELVSGNYGLYYNRDGSLYDGIPPLGYDTVKAVAKTFYYWTLDPANQEEDNKIVLDDIKYANNDTVITFTYSKNPDNWWTSYVYYIKYDDLSQNVQVEGNPVTEYPMFAPKDANSFAEGDDPFYAPKAIGTDDDYAPIGYILGDNPDISNLVLCDFPEGFNPKVTRDNEQIYIVYKSGTRKITEKYMIEETDGSLTQIPTHIQSQTESNIDSGVNYGPKYAPAILGYVAVDWAIDDNGTPLLQGSSLGNVVANIQNVTDSLIVYYIYKIDNNNNGIPDDYEGKITVKWIGKNADSTETNIHEESFIANGFAGDKIFLNENGTGELRNADDISYNSINLSVSLNNWIFVTPDNQLQYLNGIDTPLEAAFIRGAEQKYIFYYEYDSNNNGVVDKYEGHITEYYQDADGNKIAEETFDKYLEGGNYSKSAPKINNYVAVEVKIGTTSEDAAANNTLLGEEPKAEFNVGKNGNAVIFIYKSDANNNGIPDDVEGKVTAQWVGVTASGTELVMHEAVCYGYGTEDKIDTAITYASEYNPLAKWLFDTGLYDIPERDVFAEYGYSGEWYFEYSFDHENEQVLKFYFDEDYNENGIPDRLEPVKITVIGQYNGNEIYSYVINKGLAEKQFKIDAWNLPTYRFTSGYAEQYKSEIDESIFITKPLDMVDVETLTTVSSVISDTQSIEVDPRLGHQTVYFNYVSNMSKVKIKAMYGDVDSATWTNIEIPSFTQYTIPAEIGKPFITEAPHIEGYTNKAATSSSGTGAYIASVSETGNDEIIFYYVKNTGNLTVIAYEDLNNNEILDIGEEIGIISRLLTGALPISINTADSESPSAGEIPMLSNFNLVLGSGLSSHAQYNGIDNVTLTYRYMRKTRNITVEAWDILSGTKIGGIAAAPYGVGQVHSISAPNSSDIAALVNYTLNTVVTGNVQSVTVDNSSAEGMTIRFWYTPNGPGAIRVIAYYNDGTQDIEIQSYVNSYPSGIAVVIEYPKLHGWKLARSGTDSNAYVSVIPDQTATKEVKFRYEKDVYKISVLFNPNTITPPTNYPVMVEVPKGDGYQISAPFISGYIAVGSRVNGAEQTEDISLNLTPTGDMTVEFIYEATESLYTTLTVKGTDGTKELYSYNVSVLKNESITLNATDISMYTLDSANTANYSNGDISTGVFGQRTISINIPSTHTFVYNKNSRTVTIKAVSDGTGIILSSSSTVSIIGETLNINAPFVENYELLTVAEATKTHTVSDGLNEVTFIYKKITGNIRFNFVDDNNNSNILLQISKDAEIGTATAGVTPPDYSLPVGWLLKDSTGTPSANEEYVSANTVVIYKLVKDTKTITVNYYKAGTSAAVASSTTLLAQKGLTNFAVIADPSDLTAGYVLVGAPYQTILSINEDAFVNFYYEDRSASGAGAVTVIAQGDDGDIIQYTIGAPMQVGGAYNATAPNITGWKEPTLKMDSDSETGIMTVSGVMVIYVYSKDAVDIKVYVTDEDGNQLPDVQYINDTHYLTQQHVQVGSEITIFAPHISGFEIVGNASVAITAVNSASNATFKYRAVTNEFVTHTIKGVEIDDFGDAVRTFFEYSFAVPVSSENAQYSAVNIPGYAVQGDNIIELDKSVDGVYVYKYMPTIAKIKVTASSDGAEIEGFTPIELEGVIGQTFSVIAPHINGYVLISSEPVYKEFTVESGINIIDFKYVPQGQVRLVLRETNGGIIRVIDVEHAHTFVSAPDISDSYYTFDAAATGDIFPINITDVSISMTYDVYYTKNTRDVVIKAVDENGDEIEAEYNQIGTGRIGEMFSAVAVNVEGYALTESPYKGVYIMDGNSAQDIIFRYEKNKSADVVITSCYVDDTTEKLLRQYVVKGIVGNKITVSYMEIEGWRLVDPLITEKEITVAQYNNEVKFLYVSNQHTVTVNIKLGYENESLYDMIYVNNGDDYTINPPAKFGHVLYSYIIDGNEVIVEDDFTGVVLSNITRDMTVLFVYKRLMTIIPQFMVDVTVKGINAATGAELYSYTVSKTKYSGDFTVTALPLSGYEVISQNTVTFDVRDTDLTHTFSYNSTDIDITINAELVNGGSISSFTPITVIASKGLSFSYNAPYIKGYNLVGNITQIIDRVDNDNRLITFKYEQAAGNVTVILRETGTNRIIKTQIQALTVSNSPLLINVPDLSADYYTKVQGQSAQSVVYDGNSKTVEYYYTKDMRAIEIVAKDVITGEEIEVIPAGNHRVGEVELINAEQISGYILAGDTARLVIVEAGAGVQRIIFNYMPVITVEDAVVSISLKDAEGNSVAAPTNVQTTFLIPKGACFTAFAPHVEGYILTGEQSIEFADIQDNVTAVFTYKKISDVRTDLEIIFNEITSGTSANIGGSKILNLLVDNEYRYMVPDFTDAGYEFKGSVPEAIDGVVIINLTSQNNTIVVNYNKILVPVTTRHIDKDEQDSIIKTETVNVSINTVYTASPLNPSEYSDYKWTGGENQLLVTKTSGNIITLEYQKMVPATGTIVIRHIARTEDGREWLLSLESKTELLQGDYVYNLASENVVAGYTNEGYTLITNMSPTAQIGTDAFIDVYYQPEIVDINISYINLTASELLASETDKAYVGEIYVPLIKVFEDYVYVGLDPVGGIDKVSKMNVSIAVNYSEKVVGYSVVTTKYMYNGTVIGAPVVVLNQIVGNNYTHSAPTEFISGGRKYALASGEINPKTITVAATENEIVFNYEDKGSSTTVIGGGGGGGTSVSVPMPTPESEPVSEDEKYVVQHHVSYLNGYGDGTICPDSSLRRAELAVMLFKIIQDNNKTAQIKYGFTDIEAEKWYAQAINYLASIGILTGYEDGTFMPEQTITRAEATAIIMRVYEVAPKSANIFSDIPDDHWAIGYIMAAYENGFITGYPDGTFRPQNSITRAEAVKIINAMLNRKIDIDNIPANVPVFTDLSREQWFYCDIIEASVEHSFERKDNDYELWK